MSPSSGLQEGDALRSLVELLSSLFSEDELRQFIRFGPRGELIAQVSEKSSRKQTAIEFVELLARRGEIDDDFFDRLVRERPQRDAEIRAVARRLWGASSVHGEEGRSAAPVRPLGARWAALFVTLTVGVGASWALSRKNEPVAEVAIPRAAPALVPGPPNFSNEESSVVVRTPVDPSAGEPHRTDTTKGRSPAVPTPRLPTLTEDALLGRLSQNQGALARCAEQYYRIAGEPIPEGKYWIRFSVDREGGLRVGAPSEGLLSVRTCFEAALKSVEASRWRPGSADVRLDLHRIISVVQG